MKDLIDRVAGTLCAVLLVICGARRAAGAAGSRGCSRRASIDEPAKFALTAQMLRITFPYPAVHLADLAGRRHPQQLPALRAAGADAGAAEPGDDRGGAVAGAACSRCRPVGAGLGRVRRRHRCSWCCSCRRWRGWACCRGRAGASRHAGVRKIMKLMVPTLFGSSVAQVNLLVGHGDRLVPDRRQRDLAVLHRPPARIPARHVRRRASAR